MPPSSRPQKTGSGACGSFCGPILNCIFQVRKWRFRESLAETGVTSPHCLPWSFNGQPLNTWASGWGGRRDHSLLSALWEERACQTQAPKCCLGLGAKVRAPQDVEADTL